MFTGVKGVGKSTLVQRVAKVLELPRADYADYMLEFMDSRDKDAIELLTPDERMSVIRNVRELMEELFASSSKPNSYMLLENHLTAIRDSTVVPCDPEAYWRFNMAAICVISANPEDIFRRRKLDDSRNRREESISLIEEQQKMNESQAQLISDLHNTPLEFFHNSPDSLPVKEASKWVQSVTQRQ